MLTTYYSKWLNIHTPLEVEAPPDQSYEHYLDNQLDEHAQGLCPMNCLFCRMELDSKEFHYDTIGNSEL